MAKFDTYNPLYADLFPAFFRPKEDELFSSWIVRLAHAHYLKAHTFVNIYFPDYQFWNRDIDRNASPELIKKVAKKANCTFEKINNSTLKHYEFQLTFTNNPKRGSKWMLPLGIYHRTWKRNGIAYCPSCLKNDGDNPYYRKKWRLAFSVVCDKCKISLHNKCPKCSNPITFFRAELGRKNIISNSLNRCSHCNYSLSNSQRKKISPALLEMQSELYRIMDEGWNKDVFYPFSYFEVLHSIIKILCGNNKVDRAIRKKLFMILNIRNEKFAGGYKNRFETLSIKKRTKILQAATWLLNEWPFRFVDFFKNMQIYSSTFSKDYPDLPFWFWELVYSNFYKTNINRRFNWKF